MVHDPFHNVLFIQADLPPSISAVQLGVPIREMPVSVWLPSRAHKLLTVGHSSDSASMFMRSDAGAVNVYRISKIQDSLVFDRERVLLFPPSLLKDIHSGTVVDGGDTLLLFGYGPAEVPVDRGVRKGHGVDVHDHVLDETSGRAIDVSSLATYLTREAPFVVHVDIKTLQVQSKHPIRPFPRAGGVTSWWMSSASTLRNGDVVCAISMYGPDHVERFVAIYS
jgi:hypothetical protein